MISKQKIILNCIILVNQVEFHVLPLFEIIILLLLLTVWYVKDNEVKVKR
jgi:hypothetical protein